MTSLSWLITAIRLSIATVKISGDNGHSSFCCASWMKFSKFSLLTAMLYVSLSNLVLLWGCLLLYLNCSETSPWKDLNLIQCSLLSYWNDNLDDILHSVITMCSLMWWLLNNPYIHGRNAFLSLLIFSVCPRFALLGFCWCFLSKFMRTESGYFMVLFSNKPISRCIILGKHQ